MPEPDRIAAVAREWIDKGENDLKTASHTLKREIDKLLRSHPLF